MTDASKPHNRGRRDSMATDPSPRSIPPALAHELRTPLNAIIGWCEVLRMSTTDASLLEAVETIARNARQQADLIANHTILPADPPARPPCAE